MISSVSNLKGHNVSDQQRITSIIKASFGNLLEWMGFYFYAFSSVYFAGSFFPSYDKTVQLLQAAGIFAAGFIARPIGGWFYGRLADRQGRNRALIHSGLVMFAGSLLLAITPTYSSIGYGAPFVLLCARLLQGLAVGGGYGTSATYMSEVSMKNRRGFLGSFQYTTLIGGQLIATLVLVFLQQILSNQQLESWGWRIPFVIGAVGSLVTVWLRFSLQEEATGKKTPVKNAGSLSTLLRHQKAVITVFITTAAGSLSFYTFTVYMQKYLVHSIGMPKTTSNLIMVSALFICMCLQPIFGALSDRIGRLIPMLLSNALLMVLTLPTFYLLQKNPNPYLAFGLITIILASLSLYTSIGGLIKAELFPKEVRALGVGFCYGIANALFGGSAESIALLTKSFGIEHFFYYYIVITCGISLLVSIVYLPKELEKNYLEQD